MFKYKYEKILALRLEREDECKLKLGRAIAKMEELSKELDAVKLQHGEFMESLSIRFKEGIKISTYEFAKMNKLYFEQEFKRLEYEMYKASQEVELARSELLESTKEKKKYEKLKEKARSEFIFKLEKADNELIEEFVSNKITNAKQ